MAVSTCIVSGTIRDLSGTILTGATIKASLPRPFIYAGDNTTLVANYEVSTTSDTSGNWSLTLVETATNGIYMTIAILSSTGSLAPQARYEYSVQIPNTSTATFASLITGQV